MKRPWLAATLNLLPGLGYLYLDTKRLLGWLLLGASIAFVIGTLDPSLNTPGPASQGIWNLWPALFFLLPYAAFIIDGYMEAKRVSTVQIESKSKAASSDSTDLPRGAVISPVVFVLLSIVTFNLYEIYWSWQMWKTVQLSGKSKNSTPWLYAIFNRFSNFSLFNHLQQMSEQQGHKTKYPVWLLALIFLVASFAANNRYLPTIVIAICVIILAITPLPIVEMQNEYMLKTKGKYAPDKINWWLIAYLVFGFILSVFLFWNASN